MTKTLALAAFAALAPVAMADVIDQDQPSGPTYMAAFSQSDLAQSFQTQSANLITGAGVLLQANIGTSDTVTIELWDSLPDEGGSMLASGSAVGTEGEWVDVFWDAAAITPDTTYYLHLTGNTTLGLAGDTNDPYAFGQVFANAGFSGFPDFDYAFRTWVPTPASIALFGLGGMVAARRRR